MTNINKDLEKDAQRENAMDEERLNEKDDEWWDAYEEREHGFDSLTKD